MTKGAHVLNGLATRLTGVPYVTPIVATAAAVLLTASVLALAAHDDNGRDTSLATDNSTTTTTAMAGTDDVTVGDAPLPSTPTAAPTTAAPTSTTTTTTTAPPRTACRGTASVVEGAGLWLVDVADGRLRRVVGEGVEHFAWSPDGKHLAYLAGPQEDRRLVVLDVPGASRTVYDDLPVWQGPAWTADSAAIVVAGRFAADRDRLLKVPVAGGAAIALHDAESLVGDLEVRPDGSIVFTDGGALALVGADGSDREELAADAGQAIAVSPDGSRVAFAGGDKLTVLTIDGGTTKDLGATEGPGRPLAWSKDGGRVAFVGVQGGRERAVTAKADGSDRREVGHGGSSFSLAPSGAELGWVSSPTLTATDLATGKDRTLGVDMWQPTWAPDSTKLAVYAKVPGEARPGLCLWGDRPTRLAQFKGAAAPYAALAWSPAGTTLAFASLAAA